MDHPLLRLGVGPVDLVDRRRRALQRVGDESLGLRAWGHPLEKRKGQVLICEF